MAGRVGDWFWGGRVREVGEREALSLSLSLTIIVARSGSSRAPAVLELVVALLAQSAGHWRRPSIWGARETKRGRERRRRRRCSLLFWCVRARAKKKSVSVAQWMWSQQSGSGVFEWRRMEWAPA
jgi:hypothetical protein